MNEICKNCGRDLERHSTYDNDPLVYCDDEYRGKLIFKPSGRVSVPTEFIGAVREILSDRELYIDDGAKKVMVLNAPLLRLRIMLNQIDDKEIK